MDFVEAKNILELNDGFNQKDLIKAYKDSTEKVASLHFSINAYALLLLVNL